ncbi:hypothetical protein WH47_04423 [Habropoda laboriosa]|uniref:Uncharacterized protein n=1 Tax=Habropoda laboriosa TaxID=597456 RepID=A0A0L7QWM8_9HYME|nr:hypothetical protein WH47_04423 [Habropoda laboriosa]
MVRQLRESEYLYGRTDLLDLYWTKIMVILASLCGFSLIRLKRTIDLDRNRNQNPDTGPPPRRFQPDRAAFRKHLHVIVPPGART